ncbi:MAG TPA: 3-dehydroquinate synthase [Vulgatibacter sp.]|nr:3-dehydroquinate synthase [Vulgatibacter sp.]
MIELRIRAGPAPYPFRAGPGLLESLGSSLRELGLVGKVAVISDADAFSRWGVPALRSLGEADLPWINVEVPPGERSKTLAHAGELYGKLIEHGVGRGDTVVALGGGMVGDLAGFVAATYHRGLSFVQVPTTLLAQVDSSVGGKVAVDHPLGKNLVGAFHHPRLVLADTRTLATLPARQRWSGLAEVAKAALIADPSFLEFLEQHLDALSGDEAPDALLSEAIARAVRIKAGIVEADERETSLRRVLNFGHTIGHALEAATGYVALTHGEAVVKGMKAALVVSWQLGRLGQTEAERALALLARFPAPPPFVPPPRDAVIAAARRDKKAEGAELRYVILTALGRTEVLPHLPTPLLEAAVDVALET